MEVTENPYNPKSAEPMEWTNYQGVKQVGGYVLLKDLTRKEIEALKTIGKLFRYTSEGLSFRLIFKEPQIMPGTDEKAEYGSIGWKIALGEFQTFETQDEPWEAAAPEVEDAWEREDRVKEIE